MSSLEEIKNDKLKKLNLLKEKGIDPFPISTDRDTEIIDVLADFPKFEKKKTESVIAGRVVAIRGHGGLIFFDVNDGTGKIQAHMKKDNVGDELASLFSDTVDMGDFVEVKGTFFTTKRGEKSIDVAEWKMLSKSLLPLPDKWHGLQDIEERFRKRYLDLLMNEEVKERFILRSKIISEIRSFLEKNDYLEVETPVLQSLAGGATARPFTTYHNTLDVELNLRIAPELYLKKLLIGGFNKVYEIGKNFRNEGIDTTHNPEFTMLEFYESYVNAEKQMDFVEKMFKSLVKKVFSVTTIEYKKNKIDFSKKFAKISFYDLLRRYALILNPEKMSWDDYALKAKQFGVKVEDHESVDKIIDNIYKKVCRPKIIQPTFIVDYPVEFSPFAKKNPDKPDFIDRFQLIIGGMEFVNAFSEVNDPIDQRERFAEQEKKKQAGETEVSPSDEEYIEALEYGMPPAGGVGVGIDRLIMFLTNTENIREVVLFPLLRPKEKE